MDTEYFALIDEISTYFLTYCYGESYSNDVYLCQIKGKEAKHMEIEKKPISDESFKQLCQTARLAMCCGILVLACYNKELRETLIKMSENLNRLTA